MRFGRWLHAVGWAAASLVAVSLALDLVLGLVLGLVATAQPAVRPAPRPDPVGASERPGAPAPSPGPKPAGSSAVESSDVPAWTPSPARFAVAPFENRANVRAFDWLVAGAPFEISEKTEAVLGLEPTGGPLHVGAATVEAAPGPIAAFAAAHQAAFVITGWVDRPSWQLRIDLALWKVTGGIAVVAAEAQRTGDVKAYHQLLGEALGEVWSKGGGVKVDAARGQRLSRALASDLYAVTLMGRGLGHLTGAIGGQAAGAGSAAAGSASGSNASDERSGIAGGAPSVGSISKPPSTTSSAPCSSIRSASRRSGCSASSTS